MNSTAPSHFTGDFNGPMGPAGMVFPAAHVYVDAVLWAIVAVLVGMALYELIKRRSPLGLILLIGGGIALFNEPVDDILGLVWHPRINANIVIDTIGPVPLWGLPTYIIFFGGIPWLLLRELQRLQFDLRKFWIGIAITFVLDLLIELPVMALGLYVYYPVGQVPMTIFGFPLYWLLINTPGPILCAAVLFICPEYFRGWRKPFLVLLPIITDSACSIAVGLPVYTALRTPGATELMQWGGALLSCAIGMLLLDALASLILAHTRRLHQTAGHSPRA